MNVYPHRARRRFGQNFLRDPIIIQRIINALDLQKTDHIIEIGPGKGALTTLILERVQQLDLIEIDRDLVKRLQSTLNFSGNLRLHQADALKIDFSEFCFNGADLRIIGNLPYNISTPLLFHLLGYATHIHDMIFMLQKEVVDRISAKSGTRQYGRLSVMFQYYCDVEVLFDIKPEAFDPSPNVNSAIVRLQPLKRPRYNLLAQHSLVTLVKTAFSQRRKTIRNSLKNVLSEAQLKQAGIVPEMRPQDLSIKDFVALANCYHRCGFDNL